MLTRPSSAEFVTTVQVLEYLSPDHPSVANVLQLVRDQIATVAHKAPAPIKTESPTEAALRAIISNMRRLAADPNCEASYAKDFLQDFVNQHPECFPDERTQQEMQFNASMFIVSHTKKWRVSYQGHGSSNIILFYFEEEDPADHKLGRPKMLEPKATS